MAFGIMPKNDLLFTLVLVVLSFSAALHIAIAGDADIVADFIIPPNVTTIDGSTFTFTGMRILLKADPLTTFKIFKASMAEFPSLNGQSVSFAVIEYPAGSVNPPHIHPRSSELLFLSHGCLDVGFIDTTNKLFTQRLEAGDLFVFPKGLIHYQYNGDAYNPAIAVSAFGSANAGTVSVPSSIFTTGIDDVALAKSFKTDLGIVQAIKAGLKPKA